MRKAKVQDVARIKELLLQVHRVHSELRPDVFNVGGVKYEEKEIENIIKSDKTPVFVCEKGERVTGYIFCVEQEIVGDTSLVDKKSLYVDDLCVDETIRGQGVGKALFEYAKKYAQENHFDEIILNVWEGNDGAMEFYRKIGFLPRKTTLELKL